MKKLFILAFTINCCLLYVSHIQAQYYIKIDTSFFSDILQEEKNIDVFLPPDYYDNPSLSYPAIYYLHGAGGNENEGNTMASHYYHEYYDNTSQLGPPSIFVCMDGSCQPYRGSCYVNSELYGPYEDYTMQDVIGFVEDNYRVISDRAFRMITGWSMGGFGSSRLSAKYPETFRACIPCIGFLRSASDTLMSTWKELVYEENGSYKPNYNNGVHSRLFITMCGGLSPNLNIPPYFIETPFDTLGNNVDTVIEKWNDFDVSAMVKDLPSTDELSWFLIAGKYDHMACYTTYLEFMDSMDYYGLSYDSVYFDGGHEFNSTSWKKAVPWIDSIFAISVSVLDQHQDDINELSIKLFPNPVHSILHIGETGLLSEVNIYSLSGQKVFSDYNMSSLDVSDLTTGIYILEARTEDGVVREKFIKR